jgi:hypothetical protein
MKVSQLLSIVMSASILLSGCALIQGIQDQKAQQQSSMQNTRGKKVPIHGPESPLTPAQKTPSPSLEAAKMIAPTT